MTLAAKQEVLDQAFELALGNCSPCPRQTMWPCWPSWPPPPPPPDRPRIILEPRRPGRKLGAQVVAQANQLLSKAGSTANSPSRSRPGPSRAACCSATAPWRSTAPLETLVRLSRTEATGEVSRLLFQ